MLSFNYVKLAICDHYVGPQPVISKKKNSRLLINLEEPTQASKMQYVLISNKVEKLHDKDPTYIQFPEPTQA